MAGNSPISEAVSDSSTMHILNYINIPTATFFLSNKPQHYTSNDWHKLSPNCEIIWFFNLTFLLISQVNIQIPFFYLPHPSKIIRKYVNILKEEKRKSVMGRISFP